VLDDRLGGTSHEEAHLGAWLVGGKKQAEDDALQRRRLSSRPGWSLRMKIIIKLYNLYYYAAGVGFLFLAKIKNVIQGYSSPKPYSINDYKKCIEYDIEVVDRWLTHLLDYTNKSGSLIDKNVLELGPGSDLGIGLYLLSKGVSQYNAIDVNNLAEKVSTQFYDHFFNHLKELNSSIDIFFLKDQLAKTRNGSHDKLNYVCHEGFSIAEYFSKDSIDIIFSQAAFEHFDDIEDTVAQLSLVAKTGALVIAEIDLKTHSRWIRDKDPLNIYRYSQRFYNFFWFRGIPNRVRPFQYKEVFEKYGWDNIKIIPAASLEDSDFEKVRNKLASEFIDRENQMQLLSVVLCARKK
jgi:hypothetical protein